MSQGPDLTMISWICDNGLQAVPADPMGLSHATTSNDWFRCFAARTPPASALAVLPL
ncbi:hypothetical protein QQS21_000209 [Conoideocrella luteorostrata]|uniref:Uncharacterized protein n=1 Tax=Conoideocrella luteorostrata TaxID=1105319 RepID=A0AAJ0CZC5_9HYPO|nr:hypothetical protein QQS21_000209 [Conoideocrella luteorostrata]